MLLLQLTRSKESVQLKTHCQYSSRPQNSERRKNPSGLIQTHTDSQPLHFKCTKHPIGDDSTNILLYQLHLTVYLKEKPMSKQSSFLVRSIDVTTVHTPIRTKTSTTNYLIQCGIRITMPHIYNKPYYLSQPLKN